MDDTNAAKIAIAVVSKHFGVRGADIRSRRRSRQVHKARCIGMYLAFKTGAGAETIGRGFGGRDRNIVLDVCRDVESLASSDKRFAHMIDELGRACANAMRG